MERTADLELARRDIVWRLAKAGEYRDEETGDHVIRVALCSRLLAMTLGLDKVMVDTIFLTSPLHDVGKIGIPDSILLKPGRLTPEEREVMESHCSIGAAILQEAPKGMHEFLEIPEIGNSQKDPDALRTMAMEIALTHHEKWDGSGYPNGLSGDDIPISGLIVAVADVYDALRSERPYKKSFSAKKTLEMMQQGVGQHFSPTVFEAFEAKIDEFEKIREGHSK